MELNSGTKNWINLAAGKGEDLNPRPPELYTSLIWSYSVNMFAFLVSKRKPGGFVHR